MNWELLWKIVLIFTLISYTFLVVMVFFGGVNNIRDMLRDFRDNADEAQEP